MKLTYTVTWEIEVEATSPREAAFLAWKTMTDKTEDQQFNVSTSDTVDVHWDGYKLER